MKKKCILICVIIGITLLTGCVGKKDVDRIIVEKVLTGSSENWGATCEVKGYLDFETNNEILEVNSDGNYNLVLTYKGELEDLQDMRTIILVTPLQSTTNVIPDAPRDKTFSRQGGIDAGTLLNISQGNEIEIYVTWDGLNGLQNGY